MKTQLTLFAVTLLAIPAFSSAVDYKKDILPIFKSSCFKCHGDGEEKGRFSLDEGEIEKHIKNGGEIRPGNSERSDLYKLLIEEDEEDRMPPKKGPLPKEKIELIKTWIDEGAKLGPADAPKEGDKEAKKKDEEKDEPAESKKGMDKPEPVSEDWTNSQGKTIQATLIQVTAKDAMLKLPTGKIVPYPISNLSPESQEKVKAFSEAMKAAKD